MKQVSLWNFKHFNFWNVSSFLRKKSSVTIIRITHRCSVNVALFAQLCSLYTTCLCMARRKTIRNQKSCPVDESTRMRLFMVCKYVWKSFLDFPGLDYGWFIHGVIDKLRWQQGGRGVHQMSTLLNKNHRFYEVKL